MLGEWVTETRQWANKWGLTLKTLHTAVGVLQSEMVAHCLVSANSLEGQLRPYLALSAGLHFLGWRFEIDEATVITMFSKASLSLTSVGGGRESSDGQTFLMALNISDFGQRDGRVVWKRGGGTVKWAALCCTLSLSYYVPQTPACKMQRSVVANIRGFSSQINSPADRLHFDDCEGTLTVVGCYLPSVHSTALSFVSQQNLQIMLELIEAKYPISKMDMYVFVYHSCIWNTWQTPRD